MCFSQEQPDSEKQPAPDFQNEAAQNDGVRKPAAAVENPALSPDAEKVAKDVEQEVAKVVKNAVGAQQEEQLHNIAKHNHQEMLESLDIKNPGQQQQQQQQQDVPVAGAKQVDHSQQANPPQQALQQVGLSPNAAQGNVHPQQPQQANVPLLQQQVQQVFQQQPMAAVGDQEAGPGVQEQKQSVVGNIPNVMGKQQTREALKYVRDQGFLPEEQKLDSDMQAAPAQLQQPVQVDSRPQRQVPVIPAQQVLQQNVPAAGPVVGQRNNLGAQAPNPEHRQDTAPQDKQGVIPQQADNKNLEGKVVVPNSQNKRSDSRLGLNKDKRGVVNRGN